MTHDATLPPWSRASTFFLMASVLALVTALPSAPLSAQNLKSERTLRLIIGSAVEETQVVARNGEDRVIAAIDKTRYAIGAVRKATALDEIEIIFLIDAADDGLPPRLEEKVKRHEAEIARLRLELEGNAMLFHAIDSHRVALNNVIAVEFAEEKKAIVYVVSRSVD